jgi:flavin reductase (DIM6/NTAB) family NADH-FMN oxidoreductase RutF
MSTEMKSPWLTAFGTMTYGIYVLTTRHGQDINGMIASWVAQVSYEPPLIMAAVHPNRYSHTLMDRSGVFALHVLDHTQKEFLGRMKGPDPAAKFSGIHWEPGMTGCPILADCLAWFECRIIRHLKPGNHTLFIGTVVAAGGKGGGRALCTLDYGKAYLGRA